MSIRTEIQNIINKIRVVLGEDKFNKIYAESEIKISQMEVGGKVELVGPDGTLADAPDGDYELENGKKFIVKDSAVASIEGEEPVEEEAAKEDEKEAPKDQAVEEEPATEEDDEEKKEKLEEPLTEATAEPESNGEVEALKSKVADMEAIINSLVQSIEEIKGSTATKDDIEGFSKQVDELSTDIKTLAKLPVQFSQTSTSTKVVDANQQAQMQWLSILARK